MVPGFTGASALSPSGLSSRISIAGCRQANPDLTAPQIDNRQLWQRQDAHYGLLSSVPHAPCSGPEHPEASQGRREAFAWKNRCRDQPANPFQERRERRWQRCFESNLRSPLLQLRAPPAKRGEIGQRSELPAAFVKELEQWAEAMILV